MSLVDIQGAYSLHLFSSLDMNEGHWRMGERKERALKGDHRRLLEEYLGGMRRERGATCVGRKNDIYIKKTRAELMIVVYW